jgi:nitrile hydratase subunit beta
MDGIHDMGGMDGFGQVEAEPDEPVFHESWEGRVLAMNRAIGALGTWNIDMGRFGIEMLAPSVYLTSSYYERWFLRLEQMLVQHGVIEADEVARGQALRSSKTANARTFSRADVEPALRRGAFGRPATGAARFKIGDCVRTKNIHPSTHTRLPRYVRGHVGVIERVHGAHVFPDSMAIGNGEDPQWLYTVCFDSEELWGPDADRTVNVSIDAFEPYLEEAPRVAG